MTSREADKIIKENQETVKKWPKWMQRIRINAKTIATGQFHDNLRA